MKVAVVLFNLGGPDGPEAVEPFLVNLFSDPAILRVPGLVRRPLARFIARRRAPVATKIYEEMGGGSPILPNTEAQAAALEAALGDGHRVFIAMRYWKPFGADAARAVAAWRPDRVVLLPLYPQLSTTTTASSLDDWRRAARMAGVTAETRAICCYPAESGFVEALAAGIREALRELPPDMPRRLLFSAHGLPERVVRAGDPYPWQVERTAAAVMAALGAGAPEHVVCYQSRVGPLKWIGPATDAEIERAGADKVAIVLTPVAFVSEHSETLVELDIEYRHLAEGAGVPIYRRVATVGAAASFIEGLARLVRAATAPLTSGEGGRLCRADFKRCAFSEVM